MLNSIKCFYRAMLCMRGTSHGLVSVSVSVCHKSVFYYQAHFQPILSKFFVTVENCLILSKHFCSCGYFSSIKK